MGVTRGKYSVQVYPIIGFLIFGGGAMGGKQMPSLPPPPHPLFLLVEFAPFYQIKNMGNDGFGYQLNSVLI